MRTFYFILVTAFFTCAGVQAQVIIGTETPERKGALLEMKNMVASGKDRNSTKGLLLPRVELQSETGLLPMFSAAEYTPPKKAAEDMKHRGLMVYNIKADATFAVGIYVWNGAKWVRISPDF